MSKNANILCIGAIIADIICELPHLPGSGEGMVVNGSRMSLGGCAFNNAHVIRQLGGTVTLFAPLGSGMYADFIRRELSRQGLTGQEVNAQVDSGVCICLVEPNGERAMFTIPGIERRYEASWFDSLNPEGYSAACVGGYEVNGVGGEVIIEFLEANLNIQCYFAPGPTAALIDKERIARVNALAPIWHLNKIEALEYSGASSLDEAGRTIAQQSNNAVVVTAGEDGVYLFARADLLEQDLAHLDETRKEAAEHNDILMIHLPTQAVVPLDTIGAGDSHLGSLAYARAAGQTWTEALKTANKVAGMVCLQAGPTLPEPISGLI